MNRESFPVTIEEQQEDPQQVGHSLILGYRKFEADLAENMQHTTPEQIKAAVRYLEEQARTAERKIELYTDPSLETFCCMQVPAEQVTEKGEIIPETKRQQFLIGVPFKYIAGQAPTSFMQGEILHEQGHALWTDFGLLSKTIQQVEQEGGNAGLFKMLVNCVEDPRMERLVGGPLNRGQRTMLFAKNRQMIVPSLAQAVKATSEEDDRTSTNLAQQFLLLMKVDRLWEIHSADWGDTDRPWSKEDLDPRVLEAYKKVEPTLSRITGDSRQPCLKVAPEVYRLLLEEIWPEVQKLDEEDRREQQEKKEQEENGDNKNKESKSPGGDPEGENHLLNPRAPEQWPEPMRQLAKQMLKQHAQRLEQESKEKQTLYAARQAVEQANEGHKNEFLKNRDGFEDPIDREEYNTLKKEVYPITRQIARIFDRYLPQLTEPQHESSRRGTRFNMPNLLRRYGTGQESPLTRRERPEETALVLQVLVDVSGSMGGDRILNAAKACIAICEASVNRPISLEILASDDENVASENPEEAEDYLIKGFADQYDIKSKLNLLRMMRMEGSFGGANEDADAIEAALPRIRKKRQQARSEADRMASLMIFITDSTTQDDSTREAADRARKVTPLEGTAIDSTDNIAEMVRYHFGEQSLVPPDLESFPAAFAELIKRHLAVLKKKG